MPWSPGAIQGGALGYTVMDCSQQSTRMEGCSPLLSPEVSSSQWSSRKTMDHEAPYLPRSKSDLDMSRLPRMLSSSQLSYNPPSSTRSDTFPKHKEEKQSGMKQLISKSSRLLHNRRSSNKLRSMDLSQDNDTFGLGLEAGRRRARSSKLPSPYLEAPPRPYISDPYNFQHLTHTGPAQAKVLQEANPNQMISEFSAIRAAQAAKPELKGIKADDIIPQNDANSPQSTRAPSPPLSPSANHETRQLRSIKSVDSFKRLNRLTSNSFSSPHPPISPPPRRSSRQAFRSSEGLVLNTIDAQAIADVVTPNYSPKSYFHHRVASVDESLAPTQEIAQAVSTPDDSALLLITHQRNHSTAGLAGLADVPEEDEETKHDRKSKDLRHTKSFPSRASFKGATPQFGEDDVPTRFSRRISNNFAQTSWEADIDYCYAHAMDANWDDGEDVWVDDTTPEAEPAQFPNPYAPNFAFGTGALGVDSANSSSVSVPDINTPSDTAALRNSAETTSSLLWPQSPALNEFGAQDAKDSPSYPATIATETSPRSSGTGITKWSSRESLSTKTASKHGQSNSLNSISDIIVLPSGMTKNADTGSFHRTHSSESIKATIPVLPPLETATPSRSRSNSGKLLDLDLIGAPAPANRNRAGSTASKGRQSAIPARISYNLFPTVPLSR